MPGVGGPASLLVAQQAVRRVWRGLQSGGWQVTGVRGTSQCSEAEWKLPAAVVGLRTHQVRLCPWVTQRKQAGVSSSLWLPRLREQRGGCGGSTHLFLCFPAINPQPGG